MKGSSSSKDSAFAASQSFKERDYWLNRLAGEPVKTRFPHDGQSPPVKGNKPLMDTVEFRFRGELFSTLMKLSNGSDYRLHVLMVTGLALLLYKYTAQTDITVAVPIHKQQVEGELINTILTLRNQVDPRITVKEFLLQVAGSLFEADENQNYPIDTLLYKLNLTAPDGDLPFTDVAALLENVHERSYLDKFRFNMVFIFSRVDHCLEGVLEYNAALYEKSFIENLTHHFTNLLRQCTGDLSRALSEIYILSPTERNRLLVEFNGDKADFPPDRTVFNYIEDHARSRPGSIAALFETERLEYRRLNENANRLARRLRRNGVGEDAAVGILLNRSPRMLESIVAVWKAGGAYIPIETDYPPRRISEIMKDSGAVVLLTQAGYVNLITGHEDSYKGNIITLDDAAAAEPGASADLDLDFDTRGLSYVIYTS
ncbi:MAG: AMP-binding protein, partial [bacterium]|nr:AMP-binding protein [bacterium]